MPEQIISIRAHERMRVGQQLHNSTCQLLAVLQLNLGRMRRQGLDEIDATIAECEDIILQVGFHIRELSKSELPNYDDRLPDAPNSGRSEIPVLQRSKSP